MLWITYVASAARLAKCCVENNVTNEKVEKEMIGRANGCTVRDEIMIIHKKRGWVD